MSMRAQPLCGRLAIALSVAAALACGREGAEQAEETMQAAMASLERMIPELNMPESVRVGPDGRYYVSEIGEFDRDGDGRIVVLDPETWEPAVFAAGLNDPKGLAFRGELLYATDRDRVVGLSASGDVEQVIGPEAFPKPPVFLNDLTAGPDGALYVSDSGPFDAVDGAIYRIDVTGAVTAVITSDDSPEIASPNGLTFDPDGHLLAVDHSTGKLLRIEDGGVSVLAEGIGGGDGLEFAPDGTLYVTDVSGGRLLRVSFGPAGATVDELRHVSRAADLGLDAARGRLLIPQLQENSVTVVRIP